MRLLLALAATLHLAAQSLPDLEFKIRMKDGDSRFHMGGTILLELMFSSGSPEKYSLDTRAYDRIGRLHFSDQFLVEPAEGASDPLQDYFPDWSGLRRLANADAQGVHLPVVESRANGCFSWDSSLLPPIPLSRGNPPLRLGSAPMAIS